MKEERWDFPTEELKTGLERLLMGTQPENSTSKLPPPPPPLPDEAGLTVPGWVPSLLSHSGNASLDPR